MTRRHFRWSAVVGAAAWLACGILSTIAGEVSLVVFWIAIANILALTYLATTS